MTLDRHTNRNGQGKYALLNLRKDTVEWGLPFEDDEFFVLKLKDQYAGPALRAYAEAARLDGQEEWADEVATLAERAEFHPSKKRPD